MAQAKAKAEPDQPTVKREMPDTATVEGALQYEADLAAKAREIREKYEWVMSRALLEELYPLLTAPIPRAFHQTVPAVKGKPYESTGIKSVQVQIDRMNNVLGAAGWVIDSSFSEDGRVCHAVVRIVDGDGVALVSRSSHGGVDHANAKGNLFKGSFTNAAKVAFARVGVGHEIYIGVVDLDPDVSIEVAELYAKAAETKEKDRKQRAKAQEAEGTDGDQTDEEEKVSDADVAELRQMVEAKGISRTEWRTFLTSRGQSAAKDLTLDDYRAACEWIHSHPEPEPKASE